MSDPEKPIPEDSSSAAKPKVEFEDGLQKGMDAIQQVFGGLISSVKEAVGPEVMRNLEAAQWLENVADCLDSITQGLRANQAVPMEQVGQLSFHREQMESSIAGSKLETQQEALQSRLEEVWTKLQNFQSADATQVENSVASVAGYFRAAAKSMAPFPGADHKTD